MVFLYRRRAGFNQSLRDAPPSARPPPPPLPFSAPPPSPPRPSFPPPLSPLPTRVPLAPLSTCRTRVLWGARSLRRRSCRAPAPPRGNQKEGGTLPGGRGGKRPRRPRPPRRGKNLKPPPPLARRGLGVRPPRARCARR